MRWRAGPTPACCSTRGWSWGRRTLRTLSTWGYIWLEAGSRYQLCIIRKNSFRPGMFHKVLTSQTLHTGLLLSFCQLKSYSFNTAAMWAVNLGNVTTFQQPGPGCGLERGHGLFGVEATQFGPQWHLLGVRGGRSILSQAQIKLIWHYGSPCWDLAFFVRNYWFYCLQQKPIRLFNGRLITFTDIYRANMWKICF